MGTPGYVTPMRLPVLRIDPGLAVVRTVVSHSGNGNMAIWSISMFRYIERENFMSKLNDTTEYGDPSIAYPVIVEDDPAHVAPYYFCATGDPTCPCREDPDLIARLKSEYEAGLLTAEEATRIVQGRQVNS